MIKVKGYSDITTVDEIKEIIAKYHAIVDELEDFLSEVGTVESIYFIEPTYIYHKLAYELGCDLTIDGSSYCMGNSYSESEDIKAEWLLMLPDDRNKAYWEFREKKKQIEQKRAEARKLEMQKEMERKEREEYERLKAKFENSLDKQ
jgi:hypothetical protein